MNERLPLLPETLSALTHLPTKVWREWLDNAQYTLRLSAEGAHMAQPSDGVTPPWSSDAKWTVESVAEAVEVLVSAGVLPDSWLGDPMRAFSMVPPDAREAYVPTLQGAVEIGMTRDGARRLLLVTDPLCRFDGCQDNEALVESAYESVMCLPGIPTFDSVTVVSRYDYVRASDDRPPRSVAKPVLPPEDRPATLRQLVLFAAAGPQLAAVEELAREAEREIEGGERPPSAPDRRIVWRVVDTMPKKARVIFETEQAMLNARAVREIERMGYAVHDLRGDQILLLAPNVW